MTAKSDPSRVRMPNRTDVRVTGRAGGTIARVGQIVAYRELLANLVRKELKVKYKDSTLGFVWSLLNPALYLVVFYVVFDLILGSGIPRFAIYLLSGLLIWNLFSTSITAATGTIVANGVLIKKVWFPREVLPLAAIGANLVHFFLQAIVLVVALAVFQHPVDFGALMLVPLALATVLVFLAGLSILLSAANVYLRDTQHLLELAMLAWFWLTPIVYPYRLVSDKLGERAFLYLLNPMTPIVAAFQRALYNPDAVGGAGTPPVLPDAGLLWYLRNLGVLAVGSVVLLLIAMAVFRRIEGDFAEEL